MYFPAFGNKVKNILCLYFAGDCLLTIHNNDNNNNVTIKQNNILAIYKYLFVLFDFAGDDSRAVLFTRDVPE